MTVTLRTVPLEPFQRRFAEMEPGVREGHPLGGPGPQPEDAATVIAERLGWRKDGVADGGRVRRVLGLRMDSGSFKGGKFYPPKYRQWVHRPMAKRLCDAMDMEYGEVDL